MPLPPVVGLEIGTTKTVALVGETHEDGSLLITGIGEHGTTGVRKGEVIDLESAMQCVRGALQAAEESSQVSIRQVHLALSGGHIQSIVNRGTTPVLDPHGEISDEDVEQVMNIARAVNLPSDREILHTICQRFFIDDNDEVARPVGLEGARLSVDMLALHGVRSRFRNTVRVVRSLDIAVEDLAFSGLCAALAVLTPEQKESGVILIDLGGGTTNYVAYASNALAAAGALGVGGDHVTNDIAVAFNIPIRQAERLKIESGSALVDVTARAQILNVPQDGGFAARSIALSNLQVVMNSRMDETLSMIRSQPDVAKILHHVGAGVVLTGGGAHMKGVIDLARKIFGVPCAIGVPRGISGLAAAVSGPEYATSIGLVKFGTRNVNRAASPAGFFDWFASLFKGGSQKRTNSK